MGLSEKMRDLKGFEKAMILNKLLFEIDFATNEDSSWAYEQEEIEFYKRLKEIVVTEMEKSIKIAKAIEDTTKRLEAVR